MKANLEPIIVFLVCMSVLSLFGCAVLEPWAPTPVPTATPTVTATVTPTSTPTIVPTPIALISPWDVFSFFAGLVLEEYPDVKLSPLMGIFIWFEREGKQYGAMFGINLETGQWEWIDTTPIEKEQELGTETRTY